MDLDGVTLFEESMNTRIEQSFRAPPDTVVFSFEPHANHFYVLDHSSENSWITPPNYREITLVFRQAPSCLSQALDLSELLLKPLRSSNSSLFVSWLAYQLRQCQGDLEHSSLKPAQLLEDCLHVMEGAVCEQSDTALIRQRWQRQVVQQCCDLLEKENAHDLTSLDLAIHLHITPLQLSKVYRERFGLTPTEWLRLRRLNLARRDLLEADYGDVTVAEIAMRYRFWHLGRFAATYKRLFAESPLETLRRS
ncbi:helix-turn-helix domain-containing protein [Pseudomonas putida]|uniref:helix-turn-helix domain-containing protein n=1 Tax=Pseudomonas putida TaxID=303 RepID=UPI00334AEE40